MTQSNIIIGAKVYNYCYGIMTITKIDDQYVYATVDDISGAAEDIQKYDLLTPEHRFFLSSIGHWIFWDPKDIGNEDDNFPHLCQPANEITIRPELAHSLFQKKFGAIRTRESNIPSKIKVMDYDSDRKEHISSSPSKITVVDNKTNSKARQAEGSASKITVVDSASDHLSLEKNQPSKITVVGP